MKGLILCAGKGTRLQPLSFTQSKVMLPVANKSVLTYCIEKFLEIGIKDIGIVVNHIHGQSIKETLGTGEQFGAAFTYITQAEPKGISDALKQAEGFINKEPFLMLLGDNLIEETMVSLKNALEQSRSNASILLGQVDSPKDYGIVEIDGEKIIGFEEKPMHPKSDLAVIGAYAFDEHIFEAVHSISPSPRGEYEITDALQWLIDHGYHITYSITDKHYSDVGTIERWLDANRWMLDMLSEGSNFDTKHYVSENCTFIPPVMIGDGCELRGSVIGPYVTISSNSKIENCTIQNSIVLTGVQLQNIPTAIRNSIFGPYAVMKSAVEGKGNSGYGEFILGEKSSAVIKTKTDDISSGDQS